MTVPVWNWGPYYVKQVIAIIDGNWKSSSYHVGIKDEEQICSLAPITNVATSYAQTVILQTQNKFYDSDPFEVFKGPIIDQTGAIKVPKGKSLSYNEIMSTSMNWFVKGVEGKIEVQK